MYIVNIAIRWSSTGELEGFGGAGLSESGARRWAVEKAHRKAASMPYTTGFDVLSSDEYKALSVDEQDDLQKDWDNDTL